MFLVRWICRTLLAIHLLFALAAALTKELDISDKPLARFRGDLVEWYRTAGFGDVYVGIVLIGIVLILPWIIPAMLPSHRAEKSKKD